VFTVQPQEQQDGRGEHREPQEGRNRHEFRAGFVLGKQKEIENDGEQHQRDAGGLPIHSIERIEVGLAQLRRQSREGGFHRQGLVDERERLFLV
jgi:hypothetical protein